ncbi:hypothetical protein [Dapis sp. BLCC M229]|uniref:hypothetical protein n=1 Tax=Dapis sp. BLCC M229 TaxID=3400188 RepID=UPI003CEB993D
MTELLRRAISQIEKLPEAEQDAIASRLLAELEYERLWQDKFGATKDEQWDILAEMVRQEIVVGETKALEDFFCFKLLSQVLRIFLVS